MLIRCPQQIGISSTGSSAGSERWPYAAHGHLVIEPVAIGDGVTLGVCSTIMAGVTMGEGATLLPHSVLLPGSRVGAGETWGGVPARFIPEPTMAAIKNEVRRVPAAGARVISGSRPPG